LVILQYNRIICFLYEYTNEYGSKKESLLGRVPLASASGGCRRSFAAPSNGEIPVTPPEKRYAFILTTAPPRAPFPVLSHPDHAESASSQCPGGSRHSYGSTLYMDCLCKAPNVALHPLARHVGIVLQRLCHVAASVTTAANNPPSCLTG
jgi:hypothetical protein